MRESLERFAVVGVRLRVIITSVYSHHCVSLNYHIESGTTSHRAIEMRHRAVVRLADLNPIAVQMFGGFGGGGGMFGGGPGGFGGGGGMPGGPGAFDKTYKVFPSSFFAATKNSSDPEAYESSDKSESPVHLIGAASCACARLRENSSDPATTLSRISVLLPPSALHTLGANPQQPPRCLRSIE